MTTSGYCSCGDHYCKKPAKHPVNKRGASEPILDPEAAAEQWERTPNANIGIAAEASRLFIVDIDGDHAMDRFQEISDDETWNRLVNAPRVKTGKGYHFYFADNTGGYSPSVGQERDGDQGIDIRAGVSYVVAPPSIHESGHVYSWEDAKPPFHAPPLTSWLTQYAQNRSVDKEPTILDETTEIREGSRNALMTELAGSMRRRGFSETAIRSALLAENQRVNKPPLGDREIGSIAKSVARYEPSDVPASLKVASTDLDELVGRLHELDTRFLVDDNPPAIDWVWEDCLAPGTLNMLHGDGGLGKSYLSLKIAEQMLLADGGELFGKKIHPGGVVILDGENAAVEIHRRVHATMIQGDADLSIYSVDQAILGYEEHTQALFRWLAETKNPRLVIIDSQRALWAGDEKEQMEVGRMLRRLAKGLEEFSFATLLLHHDNRGKDYAGSSDTNAAISGARFHLEKHGTKNETHARRLSMPKNRIGPEMMPQEFVLSIDTMPRSHRYQISGISITPYESTEQQAARQLIDQAKMKIINAPCTNDEIWSSFGWEVKDYKPLRQEHRDIWRLILDELETSGFVHRRAEGNGGKYKWQYLQKS